MWNCRSAWSRSTGSACSSRWSSAACRSGRASAMGFVTPAFRALAPLAPYDLRPGARFAGDLAAALHRALARCGAADRHHARDPPDLRRRRAGLPHRAAPPAASARRGPAGARHRNCSGATARPRCRWRSGTRCAAWRPGSSRCWLAEWVRLVQAYGAAGRPRRSRRRGDARRCLAEPLRDTALVRDLAPPRRPRRGRRLRLVGTPAAGPRRWRSTTACPGRPGPAATSGTCCRPPRGEPAASAS